MVRLFSVAEDPPDLRGCGLRERDLSAPLQRWLTEECGLCVHAEVAVFDRSRTLDYVAHEGPCWAPTRVWNLETKVGMTAEFLEQVAGVSRGHYATLRPTPGPSTLPQGIWAVTPPFQRAHSTAAARERVLSTRSSKRHPYLQPGWLTVDPSTGEVRIEEPPVPHPPFKYDAGGVKRLLLVPQNRGVEGGLPSGERAPLTHWSLCWDVVREALSQGDQPWPWTEESLGAFLTQALGGDPAAARAVLAPYRRPRALVSRLGKELAAAGLLPRRPRYGSSDWR